MRARSRIKVIAAGVLVSFALASPVVANPSPPTRGGNGAGQSGQCTGAAADRPHGCHSWK